MDEFFYTILSFENLTQKEPQSSNWYIQPIKKASRKMGRRKSKRSAPPRRSNLVLEQVFDCPFCNHSKSCEVNMDKERNTGDLEISWNSKMKGKECNDFEFLIMKNYVCFTSNDPNVKNLTA